MLQNLLGRRVAGDDDLKGLLLDGGARFALLLEVLDESVFAALFDQVVSSTLLDLRLESFFLSPPNMLGNIDDD